MNPEIQPVSKAGRLSLHIEQWQSVTTDEFIINTIKGYKIPFTGPPKQFQEPHIIKCSKSEESKLDEAVSKLLRSGAISHSQNEPDQFVSNIFAVPKSDGGVRLVINLKSLNQFIHAPHFKMEDYRTAQHLLRPNYYMVVLDLKEAYHAIPIDKDCQKFLKFRFKNDLFKFTCLPFGLNIAPYLYTKLMRPVLSHLREKGIQCVSFLDDCLIIGETELACKENLDYLIEFYARLGFSINYEKSQLVPSKRVKFLGFIFDTEAFTISLPSSKIEKILNCINYCVQRQTLTVFKLAELIGLLVAASPAVAYAPVHIKNLEYDKNRALAITGNDYGGEVSLSQDSKEDLAWWSKHIRQSSMSLNKDKYDIVLTSDASLKGWGGESDGKVTKGTWSLRESKMHINELELLAVLFCLKSLVTKFNLNTLIRSDNTTAISYINHQGGCRSSGCHEIAKAIWLWAEERKVLLFATYINTKINIIADALSRCDQDSTDYKLNTKYFKKICNSFGTPKVDLFATRLTAQCDLFISWLPDPKSFAVDAFTVKWEDGNYAFPPVCLIPRVLNKIISEQCNIIVVAPVWTAQAWYPLYMKLCASKVLKFKSKDLLYCPYVNRPHEMSRKITIMAAVLSGKR